MLVSFVFSRFIETLLGEFHSHFLHRGTKPLIPPAATPNVGDLNARCVPVTVGRSPFMVLLSGQEDRSWLLLLLPILPHHFQGEAVDLLPAVLTILLAEFFCVEQNHKTFQTKLHLESIIYSSIRDIVIGSRF